MFVDGGDPFHLSDGCGDIDGMPASCAEISERTKNGTAVEDPGYVWGREQNEATGQLENYVHARSAVFAPFASSIGGQVPTYGLACTNASGGPYKCDSYVSGYTTVGNLSGSDGDGWPAGLIRWGPSGNSYTEDERQQVDAFVKSIASDQACHDAFKKYKLRGPGVVVTGEGVTLGGAGAVQGLSDKEVAALGLTRAGYNEVRLKMNDGTAASKATQGGTLRGNWSSKVTDGRAHIFFNSTLFTGSLGWKEVVVHEFMHAGGADGAKGVWGRLGWHDLSGFKGYEEIMKACGAK